MDGETGGRGGTEQWNKGCRVKRNKRGIPIRETDEGTAEDDSNI